jgi:hypothetical protein
MPRETEPIPKSHKDSVSSSLEIQVGAEKPSFFIPKIDKQTWIEEQLAGRGYIRERFNSYEEKEEYMSAKRAWMTDAFRAFNEGQSRASLRKKIVQDTYGLVGKTVICKLDDDSTISGKCHELSNYNYRSPSYASNNVIIEAEVDGELAGYYVDVKSIESIEQLSLEHLKLANNAQADQGLLAA